MYLQLFYEVKASFMNEKEKRMHRCCFTGHRPENLNFPKNLVKYRLKKEIKQAVIDGYNVFITGMSRGVDMWAAKIVIKIRKKNKNITLICASPYPNFETRWQHKWQYEYNKIIAQADIVRYICPSYSNFCFQMRNEWMVNHSGRVIAAFNGKKGGTKNTVEYALKNNKEIRNILNI